MRDELFKFISKLKNAEKLENVFNPWFEVDLQNDQSEQAPIIRFKQLKNYLKHREFSTRYILVGEALGYQGGHFSGIPMTSERILLGFQEIKGIRSEHVVPDMEFLRTSRIEKREKGFNEPTATIAWETILKAGIAPNEFILWNIFPWHPFNPQKGYLSNRKPTDREVQMGFLINKFFFPLFPDAKIIGVGKVSSGMLKKQGIDCFEVRHPANGGASLFREQIRKIFDFNDFEKK